MVGEGGGCFAVGAKYWGDAGDDNRLWRKWYGEVEEVLARKVLEAATKQREFVLDSKAHFARKLFSFVKPTTQHCYSCCGTYYLNSSLVHAIFDVAILVIACVFFQQSRSLPCYSLKCSKYFYFSERINLFQSEFHLC